MTPIVQSSLHDTINELTRTIKKLRKRIRDLQAITNTQQDIISNLKKKVTELENHPYNLLNQQGG
jgi:predicted RNase H-like nuclease (RuvC/YqgF family)